MIATFLWFMTVPAAHRKQIMQNVGLTMLNVTWIALLAAYLLATLDLPDGRELVIAVIALTFVYDTRRSSWDRCGAARSSRIRSPARSLRRSRSRG